MGHPIQREASSELILKKGHPDDAYVIGNHLREADIVELQAQTKLPGFPVAVQLQAALEDCSRIFGALCGTDGVLHGLAGAEPWDEEEWAEAYIWMLGTPRLFGEHSKFLHRYMRETLLPTLDRSWSSTGCLVWEHNYVHLRWLKRHGFKEIRDHISDNGSRFLFLKRSKHV